MDNVATMRITTRERRDSHRYRLYTGKHLLLTAMLVAAGIILVTPVRLSDAPPVANPGGDPIAQTEGMVINDMPVPLCATVSFRDEAEPVLPEDEIPEPVLPDDELVFVEAEPILPEEETVSTEVLGEFLEVPTDEKANNGFKSYMDYKTITSKASKQYEMQQEAWTDDQGLRRYGNYYMVALGTFYAKGCGETFRITLDSGESFDVITGDIKADEHTDEKNQHRNGIIVEFIVETKALSKTCRVMGDISHAGFNGKIESIQRLSQL